MRRKTVPDHEPRTYGIAISAPGVQLSPLEGGNWNLLAVEDHKVKAERKFIAAQRFLGDKGRIVVFSWPNRNITELTADARFNCDRLPRLQEIRTTSADIKAAFWFRVNKTCDPDAIRRKPAASEPETNLKTVAAVFLACVLVLALPIGFYMLKVL